MNPYTEHLKSYLAGHPLNYETQGADSLILDLFWYFSENNPPVNDKIRTIKQQIEPFISHLTFAQRNELSDLYSDLCMEIESLCFFGGLRIGTKLMLDLFEE